MGNAVCTIYLSNSTVAILIQNCQLMTTAVDFFSCKKIIDLESYVFTHKR